MTMATPDGIPLEILICDADRNAGRTLEHAIGQADAVLLVKAVHTIEEAKAALKADGFNAIVVDPLSLGLEPATSFIFGVRESLPEVVFVLYVDKSAAERRRSDFYKRQRKRFSHYFELDKQTPIGSFNGSEYTSGKRVS
jgi:hypothetical protein